MAILKTLFDTSVYGKGIVSKELEDTPKQILDYKDETNRLKRRLIELYEFLVKDHTLEITGLIAYLSQEYLKICKPISKISKEKLEHDFLIVACASFYGLDIVVSEDNRTMFSTEALKAYDKINTKERLRTPKFISLQEFEQILRL